MSRPWSQKPLELDPDPQPTRFWDKVDRRGDDECWEWTGAVIGQGYGGFYWKGRNGRAHRFAYELLVGPIPEGLTIDHLCRNRRCVNPAHMEPVTHQENCQRATRLITHCPKGHPYDNENTTIRQGRRKCRECDRIKCREQRRRQKEAQGV